MNGNGRRGAPPYMYSFCRGYFVPAMPTFAIVKSARATVPWSYCTPVANLGDVSDDTTVDVDVGGWWVNVKRCAIVFNSSLVIQYPSPAPKSKAEDVVRRLVAHHYHEQIRPRLHLPKILHTNIYYQNRQDFCLWFKLKSGGYCIVRMIYSLEHNK